MSSLWKDPTPALGTPARRDGSLETRPGAPVYLAWAAWLSAGVGAVAAAVLAYDVFLGGGPGMRTAVLGGSIMIGLLVLQAITAVVFVSQGGWRRPDRRPLLLLLAVPLLVFVVLFVVVRVV